MKRKIKRIRVLVTDTLKHINEWLKITKMKQKLVIEFDDRETVPDEHAMIWEIILSSMQILPTRFGKKY